MPRPCCASPVTGTIATGDGWIDETRTPIEEPTSAPPTASVMKCSPASTREVATNAAAPRPRPSTAYCMRDVGRSRCEATYVDVAIANVTAAWLDRNELPAS